MSKKKAQLSAATRRRLNAVDNAKRRLDAGGKHYVLASDAIGLFQALDDGLMSVLDDVEDELKKKGLSGAALKKAMDEARQSLRRKTLEVIAKVRASGFEPHEAN
jgi:hypothetical protein